MSSPVAAAAESPAAKVAHAPESKAKKPRQSRAKKEETDKPEKKKAEPAAKEAKEEDSKDDKTKGAAKRKAPGEKHPPFEEIIRECIAEATGDVRDGVSRPAIKSALFAPTCTRPYVLRMALLLTHLILLNRIH
jgi:hypothetical protein